MPAKPPRAAGSRAGPLALRTLLTVALLAAAGHTALWLWACNRLEAGLAAWADARRAEGWRVEHDATSRGGWPFSAALAVPGVRLEGGAGLVPGGVDWRPEAPVVLRVAPPRPDRLAVEAPGRHRLDLGGETFHVAADELTLAFPLENSAAPGEIAAAARRLRFGTPAGDAEVRAASLGFETRGGAGPATLRFAASDVALPAGWPVPARLGRTVERIGLDVLLNGAVPPGRDPARRAAAWRDGGGSLEVRSLQVGWGEVAASASADLALDAALQPAGAGTASVAGGEALLDAAAGAGLLPPFAATAARVALRALGRVPPEGGPARAEAPLALRNRSLSVGGVPLARLPALDWGAPAARRAD